MPATADHGGRNTADPGGKYHPNRERRDGNIAIGRRAES
jgi:hypothetical protein